jgi:hypothetical protein
VLGFPAGGLLRVLREGVVVSDISQGPSRVRRQRVRLRDADAVNDAELHSFKELMHDQADVIADQWYWEAFEELQAQRHLHDESAPGNGGDAYGRLSADGRLYLRSQS